jgi:hypothetical protein
VSLCEARHPREEHRDTRARPGEIQQAQVPCGQVGACPHHRPEPVIRPYPVVVGVAVQAEADDDVVAGLGHGGGVRVAVPLCRLASSRDRGKRNISRPRAEVRQVEERVEVAFHQLLGTAAEVAVAVLVRELGGGDLRAA